MATAHATDVLAVARLAVRLPSVRTHECARTFAVQEDLRS